MAGNSLIRFPFKSHKLQEVEALKREFFDVTDHQKKAKLKALIDQKLKECFQTSKEALGYHFSFDFEIVFSETFHRKGYFDVVIGNPPYVSALTRIIHEHYGILPKPVPMWFCDRWRRSPFDTLSFSHRT